MDHPSCNYSQERFNQIKTQMESMLISVGFKKEDIYVVPISGWLGENLINKSSNLMWYEGDTLKDTFDKLEPPKSYKDLPLRMSVYHRYKISGVGTVIPCKILTGTLKTG